MSDKEDALQEIVSIAKHNKITLAEITAALTDVSTQTAKQSSGILSKLFGYIGGIFVFAGICVFVSMYWDDFGSAARVIITLGTGFMLFLMALVTMTDERYARAATPLFLMSSLLQPTGIFVMLQEYSSGGDPRHGVLFMAALMLIQHGATFWAKRRTTLAFTSIVFGCIFFGTLFDMWDMNHKLIGTVIGTSLLCIAYALNHSRHAPIASFWYFIGSVTMLWSVFEAVENTPFELAYLAIAAFMIFLSTMVRSRTLLLVSTLSLLGYIAYFTEEHFANTLGWPLALIIGGLALIGLSSMAVKLNNKYIRQQG
jgi:hypothetical protein